MIARNKIILILGLILAPFAVSADAFSNFKSFIDFLVSPLSYVVAVLVSLAVAAFLWGVLKYVSAAGDVEKAKEGRDIMFYGVIGLFVMFSFWGIVSLMRGTLFGGSSFYGNYDYNYDPNYQGKTDLSKNRLPVKDTFDWTPSTNDSTPDVQVPTAKQDLLSQKQQATQSLLKDQADLNNLMLNNNGVSPTVQSQLIDAKQRQINFDKIYLDNLNKKLEDPNLK